MRKEIQEDAPPHHKVFDEEDILTNQNTCLQEDDPEVFHKYIPTKEESRKTNGVVLAYLSRGIIVFFALIGMFSMVTSLVRNFDTTAITTIVPTHSFMPQAVSLKKFMDVAKITSKPIDDLLSEETISEIPYENLYPELYSDPPVFIPRDKKIAYLTFDDGPSVRTPEVLEILKRYHIKATFFVVTNESADLTLLPQILADGHTLGLHSESHNYRKVYASVEAYLDDFNQAYNKIYAASGVKPTMFRFPGGSVNGYNSGIYQNIISEMTRRNFVYYDWNVSTQDAKKGTTAEEIYANVVRDVNTYRSNRAVVLIHDSMYKTESVRALPWIIEFLIQEGYSFESLDPSVKPVIFSYTS